MEPSDSGARRTLPRRASPWRAIGQGSLRLFRLPFDVLFLTWDYLRFTLWAVLQLWAPLLASRLTRFGPSAATDTIEVSGRRVRRCAQARKYGSPALLRLLLPGIVPLRVQHGRSVWAWEQGSIQRPTTATRYITVGLGLLVVWGMPVFLLVTPVSRHAIRRQLAWLRPAPAAPAAPVARPVRDRAAVESLCAEAGRLLVAASYPEARAKYRDALAADPGNSAALLGSGLAALELGFHDEAETTLALVLRDAPGNHHAAWGLAQLAFQAGNYRKAAGLARQVLVAQPDDVRAQTLLADSLRRLGEPDQALAVALDALTRSPADGKLILVAAEIQVDKENLDEAEALFRRALEAGQTGAAGRIGLARLLRTRGRTADCEVALKSLLQDIPDQPDAVLMLVDLWAAQGATKPAMELCQEVTARCPTSYSVRERYGALLLACGDHDGAYVSASALLRDQPGSAVAHLQLGAIFLQNRLPSLAIEHGQAVLQQGKGLVEAYRLLVGAYMLKGDAVQATECLETLLRGLPNDLESLVRLAECQAYSGARAKAVETLLGTAQRHPLSHIPLAELGGQYYAMDRPAEALAAFRKAHELAPGEWSTQNNLAQALASQAQALDQALALAQEAHGAVPANPSVADTLGWIHVLRGECAAAAPYLAFASAALSNSPAVLYHTAELKARSGDPESALRLARRAVELGAASPDGVRARQLLDKLAAAKKP